LDCQRNYPIELRRYCFLRLFDTRDIPREISRARCRRANDQPRDNVVCAENVFHVDESSDPAFMPALLAAVKAKYAITAAPTHHNGSFGIHPMILPCG
jgi:hypothetical protein